MTGEAISRPGDPSISLVAFPRAEGCQSNAAPKSIVPAAIDNMLVDLWPLTNEKLKDYQDETELSAAPTPLTRKEAMPAPEAALWLAAELDSMESREVIEEMDVDRSNRGGCIAGNKQLKQILGRGKPDWSRRTTLKWRELTTVTPLHRQERMSYCVNC